MMRVNIEVGGGHRLRQIEDIVIVNKGVSTEDHLPGVFPYQVYRNGDPVATVYHKPEDGAFELVRLAMEGIARSFVEKAEELLKDAGAVFHEQ